MPYAAPIADMRFALEACADFWSLKQRYPDLDLDLLAAILDGAGALSADTLAPLNRSGDRARASLANGEVQSLGGGARRLVIDPDRVPGARERDRPGTPDQAGSNKCNRRHRAVPTEVMRTEFGLSARPGTAGLH